MNLSKYIAILVIMIFTGCAYNVKMDPNIDPTASIANSIKLKAGLFIPEETRGLEVSDSVNLNKYTFQVGEALESIITRSASRVFVHVEVLESYPTQYMISQRNLDIVVIAKVTSGKVSLNLDQGFFQNSAEGSTSLSVQLVFYDHEMLQLTTVMASGMGIGSEGLAFSTGQKEYSASVESALRNLGDDMVHQINGNYDIRKKAEGLKQ